MEADTPSSIPSPAAPPKTSRRLLRRTLRWALGTIAVLLLLIILLPTLISTAAGRAFVLSRINSSLNGTLQISDWSIGWTGGIEVRGVRLLDVQKRVIFECPRLHTRLSLLGAMGSFFHRMQLGDTAVEEPNLVIFEQYADGSNNFQQVFAGNKEQAGKPQQKKKHAKGTGQWVDVPVSGDIKINNLRGTIVTIAADNTRTTSFLGPANISVQIPEYGGNIIDTIALTYRVGSEAAKESSITLDGKVQMDQPYRIDIGKLRYEQKLGVHVADLGPIGALAGLSARHLALSGSVNGDLRFSNEAANPGSTGSLKFSNMKLADTAQPDTPLLLDEKEIDLVADAGATGDDLMIHDLSLVMQTSHALAIDVRGAVRDWPAQRNIENLKLTVRPDWARLWPIALAVLSPRQQASLKQLVIEGSREDVLVFGGSFPVDVPNAFDFVTASGHIVVERINGNGADVQQFFLPVSLAKGVFTISYEPRLYAGDTTQPVTAFNGGKLDPNGLVVRDEHGTPRLTVPPEHALLADASINSLLGDSLGKYVNPIFANSKRAEGRLSVTVRQCDGLALNEKLMTAESGSAVLLVNLRDMQIQNPLGSQLWGKIARELTEKIPILGEQRKKDVSPERADAFDGQITDGLLTIDKGMATVDMTFMLTDPSVTDSNGDLMKMPLRFTGTIRLRDQEEDLIVTVPPQLVGRYFGSAVARLLGEAFPHGWAIPLRGKSTNVKIQLGDLIAQIAKSLQGDKLKGLLTEGTGKVKDLVNQVKNNPDTGKQIGQVGKDLNRAFGDIFHRHRDDADSPPATEPAGQ